MNKSAEYGFEVNTAQLNKSKQKLLHEGDSLFERTMMQ